ncbi:DUF4129 domain-containing protein [Saliphagus sp. GCM10025317]
MHPSPGVQPFRIENGHSRQRRRRRGRGRNSGRPRSANDRGCLGRADRTRLRAAGSIEDAGRIRQCGGRRRFPESAVSTLTETFRQVRYGNYPPTDDRIRRARAAYDRIVATASHEDGDRE